MDLYFLRHGIAAERGAYPSDFDRPLTEEGTRKLKEVGRALKKLGARPETILTSPLVRARQTAEIIAQALGLAEQLHVSPELACGCELKELSKAIHEQGSPSAVMVVGHEPDFSIMVGELIGESNIAMKKGAVAFVRVTGKLQPKHGTLVWLKTAKDFTAMLR